MGINATVRALHSGTEAGLVNIWRTEARMAHQGRPEEETPQMETRSFTDDDGRRWTGSVMSGRFAGGEKQGEVIFICEDSPSETKRFARLDEEPTAAAAVWRGMSENQMRELLRDSEPA
jgi:hypothetical protein